MNGHQPQDVDAQRLQAWQLALGGAEGALGRELAGVDLVDAGVFGPFGVLELDVGRGLVRIGRVGAPQNASAIRRNLIMTSQ